MIRKIIPVLFILLSLTPSARGEDFTIIPSIGFGFSDLEFKRSFGSSDNSRFNTFELALTGTYKRSYVRVNAEIPLSTEFTHNPGLVRETQRQDYGVALGYYVSDNVSIFGGYSTGRTSIVTFIGQYALYTEHRDKGPFFGANYSFYIGDKATLAFNLAYASMDGELIVESTDPLGPRGTLSGDTKGYSFSATWSDKFKNKANYYISYKIKEYETDLPGVTIDKSFKILTLGFLFPL